MAVTPTAENHINLCLHKIKTATFDQTTIALLLLNLRDSANKHSFTREIGDFVAHPEKDRGIALGHAEHTTWEQAGKTLTFRIVMPLEGQKLVDELKELLASLATKNPAGVRSVIDNARDDILLCYLGILHHATLVKSGKKAKAGVLGLLRAKRMGSDTNLSVTVLKAGGMEFPLISTNLLFFEKCAVDLKELNDNHRVMALREDGELKLHLLKDVDA